MKDGNLILVDGDIVTYRVGFASNDSPWPIAKSRVDIMLVDILNNANGDVMQGYLTDGTNNFRNKVAVTKPYKGNRSAPKPVHYDAIRQYLVEYHGFTMETTQEADDAIGIAQAELSGWKTTDSGVIIASIDKDLLMIPGDHYNIKDGTMMHVGIEHAKRNFYLQVLTGDSTDNIMGLKGIGPVKAAKLLGNDPDKYSINLFKAYVEKDHLKSEDGATRVHEVGELIWIRRDPKELADYWEFSFLHVDIAYRRYK
jgi:hypothetical protein